MDILPTILDLAGIQHPGKIFRDRQVVPIRGKSWVSHLSSRDILNTSVHGEEGHIHGWELFGQCAIREGSWKAVWIPAPRGKDDWELYNVKEDPGEVHDRSSEETEILQRLINHWETYYAETGMVPTPMAFPTNLA